MKVITIGRGRQNDVVVSDLSVSGQHVQIVQHDNGHFSIVDMNSTNGTYLNGRPIHGEAQLNPGDKVQIGNTLLQWEQYFGSISTQDNSSDTAGIVWGVVGGILLLLIIVVLMLVKCSNHNSYGSHIQAHTNVPGYSQSESSSHSESSYSVGTSSQSGRSSNPQLRTDVNSNDFEENGSSGVGSSSGSTTSQTWNSGSNSTDTDEDCNQYIDLPGTQWYAEDQKYNTPLQCMQHYREEWKFLSNGELELTHYWGTGSKEVHRAYRYFYDNDKNMWRAWNRDLQARYTYTGPRDDETFKKKAFQHGDYCNIRYCQGILYVTDFTKVEKHVLHRMN